MCTDVCADTLGGQQVSSRLPPGDSVHTTQGDVVDVYQREFLALRDRLHAAEQESLKRSKELNLVLDEIKSGTVFSSPTETKWICLNCGYIVTGKEPPKICPTCSHPQGYFKKQGS